MVKTKISQTSQIKNTTRKNILANNPKICSSKISKAIGLMFAGKNSSAVLVAKSQTITPLHMLFIFHSLDILFLDDKKNIVEIKQNFKPFTFYTPKSKSKFVVEVPADTINKTGTKIGDRIEF